MRLLIDMNLSPEWVPALVDSGHAAVHWSSVGNPRALDTTIMDWAREHDWVVFTHDLDFGAILAATKANGPSVIQLRAQDVTPKVMLAVIVSALEGYGHHLTEGALMTVEPHRTRVRILPLA